jgi:hypothetical protein
MQYVIILLATCSGIGVQSSSQFLRNILNTPAVAEKIRFDGGDLCSKNCKRGFDGTYVGVWNLQSGDRFHVGAFGRNLFSAVVKVLSVSNCFTKKFYVLLFQCDFRRQFCNKLYLLLFNIEVYFRQFWLLIDRSCRWGETCVTAVANEPVVHPAGDTWAWRAMMTMIMMPAGEKSQLVHQSSLAVLPAESSGSK